MSEDFTVSTKRNFISSILLISSFILGLAYVLAFGGCDVNKEQFVKEQDDPNYIQAQSDKKRGNFKEALNAFSKVVEKRQDAPESHMEIGLIYLNNLNDPIAAIYHFRKYLELKPDTKQSQFVRQCIETAQKKFAASLPCNPFGVDDYNLKLEESLRKLNAENLMLKEKLNETMLALEKAQAGSASGLGERGLPRNTMQTPPSVSERNTSQTSGATGATNVNTSSTSSLSSRNQTSVAGASATSSAQARTYTVQPGDTLSSISRKVYKTDNKWREIYEANRDKMKSPSSLKPGQVLRIP